MKIKNVIKKSCFCIVSAVLFTGCSVFPDGTINNAEDTKEVLIDDSNHIEMQLNNHIKVDADIHISNEKGWKQFKTIPRVTDEKTANERAALFAQGNEIIDVKKIEKTGAYTYTYSNGSRFNDSTHCNYTTEDARKRSYNRYIGENYGMPEDNFPLKELEDFSLNQAVKQVRELCGQMGIELSVNEPEVFVLDAQHATEFIKQDKSLEYYLSSEDRRRLGTDDIETYGEKITWNKEDEVYYMIFQLAVRGYPFSQKNIGTDSYYSNDHQLEVVVGRNEIKSFALSFEYGDKEWSDLEGDICSASDALNVIASAYQYSYGLSEQLITNIELVYLPVSAMQEQKFLARPCWQFTVEYDKRAEKDGEAYFYKVKTFYVVDAVNKTLYKSRG